MLLLTGISCSFITFHKRISKIRLLVIFSAALIIILYITAFILTCRYNFSRFSDTDSFLRFCPVGIAFFTLHGIRFTSDTIAGKISPDYMDAAHYLLFYPRLAMGPVQSYSEHSAMCSQASMCSQNIGEGLSTFIKGLAQKVILADFLGVIFSSFYGSSESSSIIMTWTAILAFALQFYFTVCGYSKMAEGIALCYGFRLPVSYSTPILFGSASDFNNNWNKTVTAWFSRLFYPLIHSQKWQSVLGIVLAWTLIGFWYRPDLHVVLCFAWMGFWIGILQYIKKKTDKIPAVIESALLIGAVFIAAAFFSSDSLVSGISRIGMMIGSGGSFIREQDLYFIKSGGIILIIAMYCASGHFNRIYAKIQKSTFLFAVSKALSIILHALMLVICTAAIVSQHIVLV